MKDEFKNNENWSKRFLPHYNAKNKFQMITYRLADSLPKKSLRLLENELGALHSNTTMKPMPGALLSDAGKTSLPGAPHSDAGMKAQYRKAVESILDQGHGSCLLQKPPIANKVIEAWTYFDSKRYDLVAYVVMPNHVHVLIKTYEGFELGKTIWSWKRHVSKFVFENEEYSRVFEESMEKAFMGVLDSRAPKSKQRFLKPASECGAPGKNNKGLWQREYWDRFIRDENHFKNAIEYIHMNPVKAGLVKHPEDWKWSSLDQTSG